MGSIARGAFLLQEGHMTGDIYAQFIRATKRRVPLVAVETYEQLGFVSTLADRLRVDRSKQSIITWDVVTGCSGANEKGMAWLESLYQKSGNSDMEAERGRYQGDAGCVLLLSQLVESAALRTGVIVCLFNAHRYVNEIAVSQALCLLRNCMEGSGGGAVVLLGPSFDLPAELQQDILVLADPLPGQDQLCKIAKRLVDPLVRDGFETPDYEAVGRALLGLSPFAARQAVSLSLSSQGLDVTALSAMRRKQIEKTKGLSWIEPEYGFDQLAGLRAGKEYLRRLMQGPRAPVALLFSDEIDKHLRGSTGGDLSGVTAGFLGTTLSFMQDYEVVGMLFYGIPGTGKTALAYSLCREFSIPGLALDFGACKGGLVGDSERNIRQAFSVARGISERGRLLFIATCNRVDALPPELESRFGMGSFFFDYASEEALLECWRIWQARYQLDTEQPLPKYRGWVGREIRQCCEIAYRLRCSLVEASQYIVPSCVSRKEELETLRKRASGRFIDVDRGGPFLCDRRQERPLAESDRTLDLSEEPTPGSPVSQALPGGTSFIFIPGVAGDTGKPQPRRKIGFVSDEE
jgi:hypothetical protein